MKRKIGFAVSVCVLVLITVFSAVGVVHAQEKDSFMAAESYYQNLEKKYVKEIRECLSSSGYSNSGVMLTRTVFEDGSREYLISIHNGRFDRLTDREKEVLVNSLAKKAFQEENVRFVYSLEGNA